MAKLVIKNRYAQVPNSLLEMKDVSIRAKGVYAYIHSRPDSWEFSIDKIAFCTGETSFKIKYALQELTKAGYLQRIKFSKGRGIFGIEYHLFDHPNFTSVVPSTDDTTSDDTSSVDTPTDFNNKDVFKKNLNKKEGSNIQHPHPISSPNDLEIDGIEKHPTELPKESSTSKSSGGGFNLKTSNSQAPQPPDIAKVGRDMFELLRKKFPKDEMDNFLNSIDIDLPTLSNMFAEYWVFEKKRTFNKGETTGVFNSFRSWMSIAKGKEIPEKEVKEGLHATPLMDKIIEFVKKRKLIDFTPQDAQKVSKFLREESPSAWALKDGTDSFLAGQGRDWDIWIKAIKGAIGREKMGDI